MRNMTTLNRLVSFLRFCWSGCQKVAGIVVYPDIVFRSANVDDVLIRLVCLVSLLK